MLRNRLMNVMQLDVPDKIKEARIREELSNANDLSDDECKRSMELGLRWVLNGDSQMVRSMGWLLLQHLKDVQHNVVREVQSSIMVDELLKTKKYSINKTEVPSVVSWLLSISPSPAIEDQVKCCITDFLKHREKMDISVLANVAKLLCEFPNCIPRKGSERVQLCEVLISNIATLTDTKPVATQVLPLLKPMKDVEALLLKLWQVEEEHDREQLIFKCLGLVHEIIIESTFEPCPALAAIIQLVDPQLLPKAVRAILRTDQGHVRTLTLLCEWLGCWPGSSRLLPWIVGFIDGLEAERQFDVLMEVTLSMVDKLFVNLQLPLLRDPHMEIVWRMVASSRHTPHVFHKIMNKVPLVVTRLLHENSDSSRTCVQLIVNICHGMMSAFPRIDNFYDPVTQVLKECTDFSPGVFPPDNTPNWCEGVELESLGNVKCRERSTTNRVGLNNLGNTCYMNSVLQALFMTYRFYSAVLNSKADAQPLLLELQCLFALLLQSQRRAISPLKLLRVARPESFVPGQQQDSSEFLTHLLDVLHEQEKLATSSVEVVMTGQDRDEKAEVDDMETDTSGVITRWTTEEDLSNQNILQRKARSLADFTQGDDLEHLSNSHSDSTDSGIQSVCGDENAPPTTTSSVPYFSLVQQIFGGRLLTSFKCLECQAESVHTDHFRDIQLAFPPDCQSTQRFHIQDLLDYFASPEHLRGENQYQCDSCGGLRDAERSVRILQFPSHLILNLKCFKYNSTTGERAKLLHRVECSENIQFYSQSYKLYATVVHSGVSMDHGHYYTIARDESSAWNVFNDSDVRPYNPPPWNIYDTPYVLFYARPEEQLQPPVDTAKMPSLRPHLMELVSLDNVQWLREKEEEEKKKKRQKQLPLIFGKQDNKENDRNDPPGGCGDNSFGLPQNRFVF